MTTGDVDRRAVAIAIGQPLGDQVIDGQAKLMPVAVPGIRGTVVWQAKDETGSHPWQVYVGSGRTARYGCSARTRAHGQIWCRLVGAQLDDETDARAYIETYLEVTRGAQVIVQPVAALADLHWRPGSEAEGAARAALLADPPISRPRRPGRPAASTWSWRSWSTSGSSATCSTSTAVRGDHVHLVQRAGGAPPAPHRPLTDRSGGPTGVRAVGSRHFLT